MLKSFHSGGMANKDTKMLNLIGNQRYLNLAFKIFRKVVFSRQEDKIYIFSPICLVFTNTFLG